MRGSKVKKYFITISAVLLIALGGYWLGKEYTSMPPEPVVSIGERNVPAIRGTYCWSSLMKGVCVDTAAPPGIISFENHTTVSAAPGTEVKIDFEEQPLKDSIYLSRWLDDEKDIQVPLKGNMFELPKDKGTYVYSVSANWNNGDAVYAFVIEVK